MVFLSVLCATGRCATIRRALANPAPQSALRSALYAVTAAGLSLALGATPAAASHPRHARAHASHGAHGHSHTSSSHQSGSRKSEHQSSHRKVGHAAHHESRRGSTYHRATTAHHRRHAGRDAPRTVAEQPAPPLTIPQFALPDLAISAATFTAGEGLAGPSRTTMIPAASASRTLAALTRSAGSLLDALVSRARSQLGTRYVFGGSNPGAALDCSSFARYAMEALGVRLPRTANQQAQIGRAIPRDVNILRPGDLLTFGSGRHVSHVGIYLGEGRFIHASVSHGQVIETTIDRNRSLFRRWQGARRLLAAAGDSADQMGQTGG